MRFVLNSRPKEPTIRGQGRRPRLGAVQNCVAAAGHEVLDDFLQLLFVRCTQNEAHGLAEFAALEGLARVLDYEVSAVVPAEPAVVVYLSSELCAHMRGTRSNTPKLTRRETGHGGGARKWACTGGPSGLGRGSTCRRARRGQP